jgi:hypothetical protein
VDAVIVGEQDSHDTSSIALSWQVVLRQGLF